MIPSALHFASPLWLLVGLLICAALILLLVRVERQRRKALATFSSRAGPVSSLSHGLRYSKAGLTVAGVALLCCALARPQFGFREEETYRRGLDLMFVIDTSKSMLTPDVKPNRLTRAKLALYDLVSKFEGDRVGLVAFAGDAFLQSPLTLDRNMFVQSLDAIDTNIIPRGGTDLGRGLRVAVDALRSQPANRKLLVVLTDGEDLEAGAIAAAREAAKAGVRIYTVGVGTPSGDLIPLPGGGFAKDSAGAFVHSRLDEKTLSEIASVTGGQYRALGADGRGLELLYQDVLAKLPQDTVGERMRRIPLERFEWPLSLGAFCLALEALLQERRRRRAVAQANTGRAQPFRLRGRVAVAGLGMATMWELGSQAHASVSDAEKDYRAGKFTQAAGEYKSESAQHPEDARLQLNLGAATYKSGDYAAANAALQQALHTAPRSGEPATALDLQQRAYYDLGNSLYRTGQKSVQADPSETIARWKEAISSYDGALKLNPRDADATYNRDLVKKKLAQLERKQKEQPPKKNDQQQKSDQQKQAKNDGAGKKDEQKKPGQGQKDDKQSGQGQAKNDQPQKPGQQAQRDGSQPGQPGDKNGQSPPPKVAQGPAAGQPQQGQAPAPQPGQPNQAPRTDQDGKPLSGQTGLAKGVAGGDQKDDLPAEPQPKPGQLSRAEARALLNSLRGDERLMTAAGVENMKRTDDEPVGKDW